MKQSILGTSYLHSDNTTDEYSWIAAPVVIIVVVVVVVVIIAAVARKYHHRSLPRASVPTSKLQDLRYACYECVVFMFTIAR